MVLPCQLTRNVIKAAIINFILISNGSHGYSLMKVVTHSDEPTDNYYPILQFNSALQSRCYNLWETQRVMTEFGERN